MGNGDSHDVVIVGGGAIGTCAAHELASDHDVLVLDKGELTNSATANAAAYISDWWYFLGKKHIPGTFPILRDHFYKLDGTENFSYHNHPYISLIGEGNNQSKSDKEVKKLKETSKQIDGVSYYSKKELEERWPATINTEGVAGGIVDEEAGSIDPVHYLYALKREAEEQGAEFRSHTEVTEILTQNGSVVGVEISDDTEPICGDNIIIASGTHTKKLVSDFVDLPVSMFVIYGAKVQTDSDFSEDMPIVSDEDLMTGPDAYDNFQCSEEIWIDNIEDIPSSVPKQDIKNAFLHIPNLYKDVGDFQLMLDQTYKCPEGVTVTSDQLPIIDSLDDPEGLIVADGSRGAVAMAPVISHVIQSILTESELSIPLEHFELGRFEDDIGNINIPFVENS